MKVSFTAHARRRMARYGISHQCVRKGLAEPDNVVEGHSGRRIAQKVLNGYVLRIIFEGERENPVVVTVYPARRDRYEV